MQRTGQGVGETPPQDVSATDGARTAPGAALQAEAAALAIHMVSAYGYSQADIDALLLEAGQDGLRSLVCDWRLSLVSSNVDAVMPEGLAQRARLEFDRVVRGVPVDEADLDWRPEVVGVAVVRRA